MTRVPSVQAFFLENPPKRAIVVGGGYIAVEFANIFKGYGSQVTQLYRGDMWLRGFDMDVRQHLLVGPALLIIPLFSSKEYYGEHIFVCMHRHHADGIPQYFSPVFFHMWRAFLGWGRLMMCSPLQNEYKEQGFDVRMNSNIASIEKVRLH